MKHLPLILMALGAMAVCFRARAADGDYSHYRAIAVYFAGMARCHVLPYRKDNLAVKAMATGVLRCLT